jgi:hypothetical protein
MRLTGNSNWTEDELYAFMKVSIFFVLFFLFKLKIIGSGRQRG